MADFLVVYQLANNAWKEIGRGYVGQNAEYIAPIAYGQGAFAGKPPNLFINKLLSGTDQWIGEYYEPKTSYPGSTPGARTGEVGFDLAAVAGAYAPGYAATGADAPPPAWPAVPGLPGLLTMLGFPGQPSPAPAPMPAPSPVPGFALPPGFPALPPGFPALPPGFPPIALPPAAPAPTPAAANPAGEGSGARSSRAAPLEPTRGEARRAGYVDEPRERHPNDPKFMLNLAILQGYADLNPAMMAPLRAISVPVPLRVDGVLDQPTYAALVALAGMSFLSSLPAPTYPMYPPNA